MKKLTVVCIEDEKEILASLAYDLQTFSSFVQVELFESADEATAVFPELIAKKELVALVITDQVMPGMTGVEFIKHLNTLPGMEATKTILLTGQATHVDTIEAINSQRLNHYVSKPWEKEDLLEKVKNQLVEFLLTSGTSPMPYLRFLNDERLTKALSEFIPEI